MGIAAIFDLTGAAVYRTFREVLPPGRRPADPFRSAAQMITSAQPAQHQAVLRADDDSTGATRLP